MEKVKITQVKPNDSNPRYIKDQKFTKLVESVKQFPEMLQARPIVVNKDMIVLGGNMRLRACIEAGLKEVFIKVVDWSEEQQKEFIIKDNLSYGEWDWDVIANEWDDDILNDWGIDLPVDIKQLEPIEAKEDGYQIPDELNTRIKKGDLIKIGHHFLLCGDSTKESDYQIIMQGLEADMICTDPPYNVDYTGGTKDKLKIMNDKMEDSSFFKFLLDFHKASINYLKKGGACYVWHADSEGLNFRRAFQECGLLLKQTLIWVKSSLVLGRQDYQWKHEPCLYGWKDGAGHFFTDSRTETTVIEDQIDIQKLTKDEMRKMLQDILIDKTPTTVLHHDKPHRNDLHPTMKPVGLMGKIIENSTKQEQIILDPFIGSGSTMVAAHQLNRKCYGIELDPKYCQVVIDRMIKLDPELEIKINGKNYELPV